MANYKVTSTTENIKWPAYVSTVILQDQQLAKAETVLEKALVTLEAYGGPNFVIAQVKAAKRTGIFLYEIFCELVDSENVIIECLAMILYEPWMKANSIAAASFEFANEEGDIQFEKLVMKRKKSIIYYKDSEMSFDAHKNETEQFTSKTAFKKAPLMTDV